MMWLLVVSVLAITYWFSSATFASHHTARYLGPHNGLIRELAHVAEYAGLFLVLRWVLSATLRRRTNRFHVPAAFLVCVLWAAADEWHQSFVPSRSASLNDVLLDTTGAALGCLLFLAWGKLRGLRSRTSSRS
jgi:VanZ family protein